MIAIIDTPTIWDYLTTSGPRGARYQLQELLGDLAFCDPFLVPSGERTDVYTRSDDLFPTKYRVTEPCYRADGRSHDGRHQFVPSVDNHDDFPNGYLLGIAPNHKPVAINPEDVDMMVFDHRRFMEVICRVLNIDFQWQTPYDDLDTVFLTGNYEPVPGRRFPVYWVPRSLSKHAAQTIILNSDTPCIVFSPAPKSIMPEVKELFEKHGHFVLALSKIVTREENGEFVAQTSLSQVLGSDLAQGPALATPPPYALENKGDQWLLRFDGRETMINHSTGVAYIARLMESPGREFMCTELEREILGQPEGKPAKFAEGDGQQGVPDAIMDEEAMRQIHLRYQELQAEFMDADVCNDIGRQDSIQQEKDALLEQLQKAKGIGGKQRTFDDEVEKSRKRVGNAIRRALKAILDKSPDCGAYLALAIEVGRNLAYQGESGRDWHLVK